MYIPIAGDCKTSLSRYIDILMMGGGPGARCAGIENRWMVGD